MDLDGVARPLETSAAAATVTAALVMLAGMGGTVDPKTGEIEWVMNVPLTEQLAFYRSHPPSALGDLRAAAVEHIDWKFDGHGEPVNSIFELACPCGSKLFTATCGIQTSDDINEVSPPIGVECDACEAAFDVFDPSEHGWNAVLCGDTFDEPEAYDDLEGDDIAAPHEVIVRFEHGSETLGDPELVGREQDVFTWFTLLARDPDTKRLEQLFEWECA
jgi:hypothetical protein